MRKFLLVVLLLFFTLPLFTQCSYDTIYSLLGGDPDEQNETEVDSFSVWITGPDGENILNPHYAGQEYVMGSDIERINPFWLHWIVWAQAVSPPDSPAENGIVPPNGYSILRTRIMEGYWDSTKIAWKSKYGHTVQLPKPPIYSGWSCDSIWVWIPPKDTNGIFKVEQWIWKLTYDRIGQPDTLVDEVQNLYLGVGDPDSISYDTFTMRRWHSTGGYDPYWFNISNPEDQPIWMRDGRFTEFELDSMWYNYR